MSDRRSDFSRAIELCKLLACVGGALFMIGLGALTVMLAGVMAWDHFIGRVL
jgi:hypothetical protein